MAATVCDTQSIHYRFRSALIQYPIRRRIECLILIFDECTIKELQAFYPVLIDSIFGISAPSCGWNLTNIVQSNVDDFNSVIRFLYPLGELFNVAYKLLSDVYQKYEYPFAYLPASFRQLIEQGNIPPFYMEKLNVDAATRTPLSFSLNSLELYMFHFAFHLVSPWQVPGERCNISVYLHLTDQYLTHFLPIDTSVVLPVVTAHQPTPRSPPPQVQPVRVSKLLKSSALNQSLNATSPPVVSQPHAEIWRSETLLHVIIYFWLYVPDTARFQEPKIQRSPSSPYAGLVAMPQSPQHYGMEWQESRASKDHLRTVRNLIKHMHFFANNVRNDGGTMDELRRSIRNVLKTPIVSFICRHIHHWPLDSSFQFLLETYLSYIQPWRYQRYSPALATGESTRVDSTWSPFIHENLQAYTAVVCELISRFSRMDLSSPKHSLMVFRLAKVLSEPDLPSILYQADLAAQSRGDVENHVPLFTRVMEHKVADLLRTMTATASLVQASHKTAHKQQSSSILQVIRDFLLMNGHKDEYSSSERQETVRNLEHAVMFLSSVFGMSPPEAPAETVAATSVQPSLLDPRLAQKRAWLFKYGGNPDLQPIRTTEVTSLVQFLHRVSSSINDMYGCKIAEVWHREDLCGRVSRQLLAPPCQTFHFQKSGPGNPAPRVSILLPPRVCLRGLASYRFLWLLATVAFFPHIWGLSSFLFYTTIVFVVVITLLAKAFLAPFVEKDASRDGDDTFTAMDVSFNE